MLCILQKVCAIALKNIYENRGIHYNLCSNHSYKSTIGTNFTRVTANAKDSEVIKKVHGFWVIHMKN